LLSMACIGPISFLSLPVALVRRGDVPLWSRCRCRVREACIKGGGREAGLRSMASLLSDGATSQSRAWRSQELTHMQPADACRFWAALDSSDDNWMTKRTIHDVVSRRSFPQLAFHFGRSYLVSRCTAFSLRTKHLLHCLEPPVGVLHASLRTLSVVVSSSNSFPVHPHRSTPRFCLPRPPISALRSPRAPRVQSTLAALQDCSLMLYSLTVSLPPPCLHASTPRVASLPASLLRIGQHLCHHSRTCQSPAM
jgi:hypothetical protein